jgi:preprotein translocase subunit Sss1
MESRWLPPSIGNPKKELEMTKEQQALTRIGEIVGRCVQNNKKPTQDELLNILQWCNAGLGIDWLEGGNR